MSYLQAAEQWDLCTGGGLAYVLAEDIPHCLDLLHVERAVAKDAPRQPGVLVERTDRA
jgi:hypothetical protein